MKPRRQQSQKVQPAQKKASAPAQVVQIEKPIYGGSFLAREQGKAVFVPLALPGEQVRVRIVEDKAKRGYAIAEVEEVVVSAAERIEPLCPHFGPCGGCNYQHASYAAQLKFKEMVLRETLERGGITPPEEIAVLAGEPWGYRNRIRLAIDRAGRPGYRGRRSHEIVPIRACPIAAPLLVRGALALAETLRQTAPSLRPTEIALFCDAAESALLASVFVDRTCRVDLDELARAFQQRIPEVAGMEVVLDAEGRGGPRILAQWGATSLHYPAADSDYRVDHGAFFQVNRWLVDALVERATAGQSGTVAWDLFAGVGLFARQLTKHFEQVIAVESAPFASEALAANLSGTPGDPVTASTLQFLTQQDGRTRPDLIVVDPPRTGLGSEVTARLSELAAPNLVYVSCDPATLTRDLRSFLESGYAIQKMALADLFPQTFHLETVVHLRRS